MNTRSGIHNSSGFAEREALAASVFPPSALGEMEGALQLPGSLLEGILPTKNQFRNLTQRLGLFAAERIVGFTPVLETAFTNDSVCTGGVCALSTRESTLLNSQGQIEDPKDGTLSAIQQDGIDRFSDVTTVSQIVESIGLTPNPSALVLEDTLWSNRVIELAAKYTDVNDDAAAKLRSQVELRNLHTFQAVQRLREFMFATPANIQIIRDTEIMEDLTTRTDEMLARLGLLEKPGTETPETETSNESDYRKVYAGMYSYVWRQILESESIVKPGQLMVIYEPWKHFAPEDKPTDPISAFRQRLLQAAPFMEDGSPSEQLGLIAYLEPRDPNGRLLRKSVPTALLPNSVNYRGFDFGRFPVVPKSSNKLPGAAEFKFVDELGVLSLGKNPAFLWGLVYPPTPETVTLMTKMRTLNVDYKEAARAAKTREILASTRSKKSSEMRELAEQLIGEIQILTNVMFGATNATN